MYVITTQNLQPHYKTLYALSDMSVCRTMSLHMNGFSAYTLAFITLSAPFIFNLFIIIYLFVYYKRL